MRKLLTAEVLRKILHYDPETGVFIRKVRCGPSLAGTVAGWKHPNGYVDIKVKNQTERAHRLAWLYMTGKFPNEHIDHIDGNRANNRFSNLRAATNSENQQNRHRLHRRNTSGVTGVAWNPATLTWQVTIAVDGRRRHLGTFRDFDLAVEARRSAEKELHPFRAATTEKQMKRLRELAQKPTRWFDHGAPLKISMINEDIRDAGLIDFDDQGWIAITPAGMRLLYGRD